MTNHDHLLPVFGNEVKHSGLTHLHFVCHHQALTLLRDLLIYTTGCKERF